MFLIAMHPMKCVLMHLYPMSVHVNRPTITAAAVTEYFLKQMEKQPDHHYKSQEPEGKKSR